MIKVISFDPGYERLGIAIIEKISSTEQRVIKSLCFQTKKEEDMSKRLFLIQQKIDEVIKEHKPTHMSLEMIFQNTNQKTVTNVSAVRGIILACAGKNELPVLEFSPPQIKLAVCGNGRADKKNVHKMVSLLTNNKYINKLDDEMDAIAVGLTALAHIKE